MRCAVFASALVGIVCTQAACEPCGGEEIEQYEAGQVIVEGIAGDLGKLVYSNKGGIEDCMRDSAACATPYFLVQDEYSRLYLDRPQFFISVTIEHVASGVTVALPSPDVTIRAFEYHPNSTDVEFPVISGEITVELSENNFDARYELTLDRGAGQTLVVQGGRFAALDGSVETACINAG